MLKLKSIPESAKPTLYGLLILVITFMAVGLLPHLHLGSAMKFGKFMSGTGNLVFLILGYLIYMGDTLRKRDYNDFLLAVSVLFLESFIVHAVKQVSGAWLERPSGSFGGFPSGHSAAAFALAFLLATRFTRGTLLWYALAGSIAWSRTEVYAHWPYQIYAGAAVGFLSAQFLYGCKHPVRFLNQIVYRYQTLLVAIAPLVAFASYSFECENPLINGIGAGIFILAALLLRISSRYSWHQAQKSGQKLCTSGPYALVRHPMYIANSLLCIGLTISTEILWILPLTILACLTVYSMAARTEEKMLLDQYGDEYRAYQEQVPAWLPHRAEMTSLKMKRAELISTLKAELPILLTLVPVIMKELL